MIRSILAFVAAVLVTYVLAAAVATAHVLGSLRKMGMTVDFGVWAQAVWHDLLGMFPTFAPLIAAAFVVALPVIRLVSRGRSRWLLIGCTSGFFVAIVAMHLAMTAVLNVTPVASARSFSGLLLQGLAGAAGGYVLYRLAWSARSERAGSPTRG